MLVAILSISLSLPLFIAVQQEVFFFSFYLTRECIFLTELDQQGFLCPLRVNSLSSGEVLFHPLQEEQQEAEVVLEPQAQGQVLPFFPHSQGLPDNCQSHQVLYPDHQNNHSKVQVMSQWCLCLYCCKTVVVCRIFFCDIRFSLL